ncbi:MAG: KilA-N domain-containing protein, partial [Gammaproteobacteria bacterium]|nr:KilA-N domain-containing protein [Gammaproteobacteria bacterium]
MKKHKINIESKIVTVDLSNKDDDYISLTDIARFKDAEATGIIIANWLSTKYTIQFIGAWEQLHNQNFNVMEFNNIKNEAGS